jgi:hypothetical protein
MNSSDTHTLFVEDDTIGFLVAGASLCSIIALIPYINIVNYVGVGVFAGGFLSVFLAGLRLSRQPNISSSFKFGALAGIIGGVLAILVGDFIYLITDYDVNQARFALLLKIFQSESDKSTPSGIAGFHIADESGNSVPIENVAQIPFTLDFWTILQQLLIVFLTSWLPGGLGGMVATLTCKRFFSKN